MEKIIEIRSDYETLMFLYKEVRLDFIKNQIQDYKKWFKYLLISICLAIGSYLLTALEKNFIVISFLSTAGFFMLMVVILFFGIKQFLIFRRYSIEFAFFVKSYNNLPIVKYTLTDDFLYYNGQEHDSYPWATFVSVVEYEGPSFKLFTNDVSRDIWIPKSVMVNIEDYDFFKDFVTKKISEK